MCAGSKRLLITHQGRIYVKGLFVSSVLFTDEATSGEDGITISTTNISGQRRIHMVHQKQFRIKVWAGSVDDCLVGPHVLPQYLVGKVYRNFLLNRLP
jgi:hypothetical protein